MAQVRGAKPTKVKVQEHRDRLRAQGLRPIQIWVPDVRASSFRAEAHRQSLAVATSAHAAEDQARRRVLVHEQVQQPLENIAEDQNHAQRRDGECRRDQQLTSNVAIEQAHGAEIARWLRAIASAV